MTNGTLVDADVLLDVLTDDPTWLNWSLDALAEAAEAGPLWINPTIHAEASVLFSRIEDLQAALAPEDYRRAPLPRRRRSWPVRRSPRIGVAAV